MMITISSRKKQLRSQQQQAGIVSIIVATMLIIIVSLIVLAFAQVSRREQRESLDAQLSTQAYYAAETGVNAATAIVNATNPAALTAQPECKPTTGPFANITYNIDVGNNVAITCLTVDPAPTNLSYTLSTSSATVVPILPANGAVIDSLTFSWPKSPGLTLSPTTCKSVLNGGAYVLPSENTWNVTWGCPYAAIRADFVPGDGGLNRNYLLDNDKVSVMLPVDNTRVAASTALSGVSTATCDDSACSVTFSGLNHSSMYLRLISLYRGNETVTITGTDTSGTALKFTGAQAKIDATGRAQDVLRRIVVSSSLLNTDNASPSQALVSGDSVCKKFGVFTGYYLNFADPTTGCN